ncbi:carbohydrate binding domain-containing protein [Hymenobacter siberiensis]|uniref:carbohydrate binding domain-containing protein n=1 Tax=Hymenobacter siberiensis TaxID=2848396 RepID=UPI001C1DFA4E|nr:carbohydrate binding domain-containing protein [Hymenobacter siberiensis]
MRKNILNSLVVLAGTSLLLVSCSKDEDKVKGTLVTHNDFEAVLGWGGTTDISVNTEKAHSGKYSIKTGPQNEYAYTYSQTLGQMSPTKIKELTLSAWVWVPNAQASSTLVVSINHSTMVNTVVYYGGIDLSKDVTKYKSWQHVSKTFTLPDSVQSTNHLKCYLWRAGNSEAVYVDDMTLSVGE